MYYHFIQELAPCINVPVLCVNWLLCTVRTSRRRNGSSFWPKKDLLCLNTYLLFSWNQNKALILEPMFSPGPGGGGRIRFLGYVKSLTGGNGFPLFWSSSAVQLWPPPPFLHSPLYSQSRFLLFLSQFKASLELTSVLHHFYAKVSLRPSVSWVLLAIFGVNVGVANVEIRTVMRSPIPNQTTRGWMGKSCGNAPCPGAQRTGCKGPGTHTPHAPRGSQPLAPLCGKPLAQCAH